ncbi:zinc finger CCCH domain-containing protein 18-like isoform X1 [Cynara cardunculus var. scolymus]|uniref:zinc finger CCCH domain-containing protein 18-like isoform X1 n=1 Tax=Cynara cardunculus var. scolymus TaxID=59895 RepID=UPI000D6306F4|nr:zinc finger CCCH domain-containing protein 18-like isoform X1 [Cynara cardunculus var. scolymus]
MDFSESTKTVYDRIQKIEPENVSKIIGYLLLQDHGEREMIRLAFGPDKLIHSLISKAKTHLKLPFNTASCRPLSPPQVNSIPEMPIRFTPFSPSARRSPSTLQVPTRCFDPHGQPVDYVPMVYPASFPDDYRLHNQLRFLSLEDQIESVNSAEFSTNNYYSSEPALGPRANRRSPSLPEFPFKVCHYFIKGFCRHGNNCRYLHPTAESFSQIFSPGLSEDDHVFSPGSLEKLELELTELLKSRRGFPVSIASLPMLYYEKFGKTLQAEGYLTESQRHGKAGYSLTKLLARLKSICLIDRPHGQHAVVLADDLAKCTDHNGDRNEHGGIVAGSRQIYLTFPAESTFSERDVFNYFNKFGPVHDVRIPCQQKRMFGFVTFVFEDTVRHILNKGNPHFVSGARVLIKPYREKSKADDRKHGEMFQNPMCQGAHCLDTELGLHSMPRICDNSRLLDKQLIHEQQEQALEFERRRFSEMQLAADPNNQLACFATSLEELKLSEGNSHAQQMDFPTAEQFNYLLDVLNSREETIRQINTKYNEQESSQGLNLPDSPFASALGGEISTVI